VLIIIIYFAIFLFQTLSQSSEEIAIAVCFIHFLLTFVSLLYFSLFENRRTCNLHGEYLSHLCMNYENKINNEIYPIIILSIFRP
jgi:hypothetical protein